MCGIAGFDWNDEALARRMTASMAHRGPDAEGYYTDHRMSLGHLRLSIVDLSENGRQPMAHEHLLIVYNGEVYNFWQLRAELEKRGHRFRTATDTEVILHAYEEWGEACVSRFNGMWAFCIYDTRAGKLFLSRDRFGIKPLHYYFDGKRFAFASEFTAVLVHAFGREVDLRALNMFFYQKYVGDEGLFKNCFKVQPGGNITYDLDTKTLRRAPYYDLDAEIRNANSIPLSERVECLEATLGNAVETRLIADVPVGTFLSGGIDSSLISALIARNHKDFRTFSIGFREASYDEALWSRMAANHLGTAHRVEYLDMDEGALETVLNGLDEPFGDSSVLPTYLLSKITRQEVTVALSGDAGDELFGGYDTYQAAALARLIPGPIAGTLGRVFNALPPTDAKVTLRFKAQRFFRNMDQSGVRRHHDWMATFPDDTRKLLLRDAFVGAGELIESDSGSDLVDLQRADFRHYLPGDILKKLDIASMLNSLEARVPFLDHRLVPLALSLPEAYKIRRLRTKWWLKEYARRYLPKELIHRQKRGLTVPVSKLIKSNRLIQHHLRADEAYGHAFVDRRYAAQLLEEHMAGRRDNARELWLVFVFNYWWERNGAR